MSTSTPSLLMSFGPCFYSHLLHIKCSRSSTLVTPPHISCVWFRTLKEIVHIPTLRSSLSFLEQVECVKLGLRYSTPSFRFKVTYFTSSSSHLSVSQSESTSYLRPRYLLKGQYTPTRFQNYFSKPFAFSVPSHVTPTPTSHVVSRFSTHTYYPTRMSKPLLTLLLKSESLKFVVTNQSVLNRH